MALQCKNLSCSNSSVNTFLLAHHFVCHQYRIVCYWLQHVVDGLGRPLYFFGKGTSDMEITDVVQTDKAVSVYNIDSE